MSKRPKVPTTKYDMANLCKTPGILKLFRSVASHKVLFIRPKRKRIQERCILNELIEAHLFIKRNVNYS